MKYSNKQVIEVKGWITSNRVSTKIGFLSVNNLLTNEVVQVIYKKDDKDFDFLKKAKAFSSISLTGLVQLTPNRKQEYELLVKKINYYNEVSDSFPIQNKEQSLEFLRENLHFRSKTKLFKAIFKIRSIAMFSIENYFNKKNFIKITTPVITESDTEGAGETFTVTTINDDKYQKDFFGKKASLTVSGQLTAEAMAQSLGNVYTFGPTFRAEKSNTIRHISEFWMLEPEIVFSNIYDGIKNSNDLIKFVIKDVLSKCQDELSFLENYNKKNLIDNLKKLIEIKNFKIIEYKEAIDILQNAVKKNSTKIFQNSKINFGLDLGIEHEKYLVDQYFKEPVFIINYPKSFKSFYMYQNDDNKTVAAFDLIVPNVGEIVGGSQRETRPDFLLKRINELKIDSDNLSWYIDLRKNGMIPSTGYGLGFERLIMLLTGMNNIKDVIHFPRSLKNLKF